MTPEGSLKSVKEWSTNKYNNKIDIREELATIEVKNQGMKLIKGTSMSHICINSIMIEIKEIKSSNIKMLLSIIGRIEPIILKWIIKKLFQNSQRRRGRFHSTLTMKISRLL